MPRSASESLPKVSCLLVTADRPALCRRAVRCYRQQTYPNKELVVLDNGHEPIEALLEGLPEEEVCYLYEAPSEERTIGALRNRALEEATGAFVVPQWDDDDWSHPERLARQAAVLREGYDACALHGSLMHVDHPRYFHHPFIGLLPDGVPPTIMHRRDPSIRYPDLRRTSDTPYLQAWREKRFRRLPRSASYLYLRYFHGGNLWEQEHFVRRARNTPKDFVLWLWHKYVRRNEFGHPRYRLTEQMEQAFARYLEDSYALGLFERDREEAGRETARP